MSQSVWATRNASAKSVGQARRRHGSTFAEEPASKRMKVKRQDKTEETEDETSKKIESQSSSLVLVPRCAPNVPQMQITEFAVLPTHPSPALGVHAHRTSDQSVMRPPKRSHANEENVIFEINKRFARLYLPSSIISQEGSSAIASLKTRSEWKWGALVIAFGLLNRQVGDKRTLARTVAKAGLYYIAVLEQGNRPWARLVAHLFPESEYPDRVSEFERIDPWPLKLSGLRMAKFVVGSWFTYERLLNETKAWEMQNPGATKQFGKLFWERVGALILTVPTVNDLELQVGLVYIVLMDVQALCSQGKFEDRFDVPSQHILVRCLWWAFFAMRD